MKNLLVVILMFFVMGAVVGCDRQGREYDRTLDRADALMQDHPDSALTLINSLDTAGRTRARIARYALLLTKAQDKNYLIPTNDSLILKAVNYYCGHRNAQEIQSLYLYSHVLFNKDSIKNALPYALIAYEMADEKKDWFYIGMSARLLSDIYKFLYNFPDQKKYAILSKNAFLRYESEMGIENKYSSWMDYIAAEAMTNNNEPEKSLEICNNIDPETLTRYETLRHYIWLTKAKAYFKLNQPLKSVQIFDTLINDGYKMEGWNWNRLSEYYYYAGNLDKAHAALDSAKNKMEFSQDSIYISYLEYLLSNPADFQKSLEALKKYNSSSIKATNDLIINSPIHHLSETYHKQANAYKHSIAIQKIKFWIFITFLILVILIGGGTLHHYNRLRKTQNIALKNKILNINSLNLGLEEKVAKITIEHKNVIEQYSKELSRISREDAKMQSELIRSILNNENEYCTQLYLVNEKEKNNSSFIKNSIKTHTSEKSLLQIDSWIDLYSDGFIDTIRMNFPRMRQSRLRLVRYLYAGFNLETILLLQNLNSRNTLDHAKWDLKKKINEKETWIGTESEIVLKKLKLL